MQAPKGAQPRQPPAKNADAERKAAFSVLRELSPDDLAQHAGALADSLGDPNARDAARTAELTTVQASAYARQMRLEDPGCTHCCILGGLEASRIRIVELWMNEKFFQDHEKSQWHDEAEQKVVPLVADMTCDSVRGMQYECPQAEPKNKT